MPKVKITKLPKGSAPKMHGAQTPPKGNSTTPDGNHYSSRSNPEIKVNQTLQPTTREHATLEAEKGETIITNLQGEGIPEFYKIAGKPHSKGGTPLNVPSESFIFSKDKTLAIKDPEILEMFGKTGGKKKYTPAELSMSFNLNKYREILANPFTDKLQRETAEKMIQNYNLKLGKLALVQESMKGFDSGVPKVAMGYLEHIGMPPEQFTQPQEAQSQQMAQFGLETFQGGGSTPDVKRKVKVTSLPKYAKAGEVPITSNRPTPKQNIPKKGIFWDPASDGYDVSKVKTGHYLKDKNGRWTKVTGFKKPDYTGDFKDENLGDFQSDYGMMADKFKDENFKKAFLTKYRASLKNAKANPKTGLTQEDINAALQMEDDAIVDNFLKKERINYAINNKYGNLSEHDKKNLWDKNRNLANETAAELGYDPLDKVQIASFQAGYIGLNDMAKDPEYKGLVSDFVLGQAGKANDYVAGEGKGTISQIDGWDGNTTSGELMYPKAGEMMTEEVENIKQKEEIPTKHLNPAQPRDPGNWWTQDVVNLGVGLHNMATRPERKPWTPNLQYREAVPTFTSFAGAAARQGSQLRGAQEVAANMMSPQALGATLLAMQAQAVPGLLQMQEQENKTNVGVANQFELANAQGFNQFARADQAIKKGAYAEEKASELQDYYDGRRDKEMVAGLFNQGWTNKGKTRTMNELHPDFAVDPITGYLQHDPSNRPITPTSGGQQNQFDEYAQMKEVYPDLTMDEFVKMKNLNSGSPVTAQVAGPGGYPGTAYQTPQPGQGVRGRQSRRRRS